MSSTIRFRIRDRLLLILALLGFLLICFAAAAARRPTHAAPLRDLGGATARPKTATADPSDIAGRPPKPFHVHFPGWLLLDLIYLLAAIGFGLIIWGIIKFVPLMTNPLRRRARRRGFEDQDDAPSDLDASTQDRLARTFTDALAVVDVGDTNRAIVGCWIRLEQIAEEVGFPRQAWETSSELVTRWLGGWRLPTDSLNQLAELYREARYSGHAMSREQIELARSTLTKLRMAFRPIGAGDSSTDPAPGGGS